MGQIVSVDVKHSLGAEEAKRRVQAGIEAMQAKYGEQLSFAQVEFNDMHADVVVTTMGHSLKGAFDFLPIACGFPSNCPGFWRSSRKRPKA